MKRNFVTMGFILVCMTSIAFAADSNAPTSPTKGSEPTPTLQKTHNIDTVLAEKVQSVIAKLPILKGQAVTASSHERIITLQGSVENKEQEEAAIKAAKSVNGVKEVESQLTIKLLGN